MKKMVCENLVEYEILNENIMTEYFELDKSDEEEVKKFALDLVCKTYYTGVIWKHSKSYNFFKELIKYTSLNKILNYIQDAAVNNFRGKSVLKYENAGQNRMKKIISWSK